MDNVYKLFVFLQSGSRKETKQLSRSMSMAHPWGPRFIHNEIDYSRNNNLPPRPPSRSPSGSLGINTSRQTPTVKSSSRSPSKSFIGGSSSSRPKPPLPVGRKQPVSSSSVESLLRQDTPDEVLLNKKKGSNTKLGRSKSMSVSQSASRDREPRDGKGNRFSTLWFNKKNSNK